ncbi:MAG TPA: IscS subfamily cysteine desulfurase [Pseudomonadales bacterium]|jgi:cysteine desulfurase|nr:IscS subfamily cysteine desulfurase [Pseudomonadales bacterium]
MRLPVYLDYLATTPVDPRVAACMAQCLTIDGNFGNPSSRSHIYGWRAEEAVEQARREVAELVGADPREIVWTSGATEADNLALKGVAHFNRRKGRHIVTSTIEHKAVLDSCRQLETEGFELSYVAPDAGGIVQPAALAPLLREDTILVSVMHVNNELGTVNDIAALGALCRERGIVFHVDAAQGAGKLPIDLAALPVDLASLSAHKMYGPKGVGALYVRRLPRVWLEAQMHGGGHERGMRSGTLPTHQIVGMGEAARLARAEMQAEAGRIAALRDRLWASIADLGGVGQNGDPARRVAGALNVRFAGVEGESMIMAMKDIAVSSGSACTSASLEPSHVLRAIGLGDELAHASLRFSLGRFSTDEDVALAADTIRRAVTRLRGSAVPEPGMLA